MDDGEGPSAEVNETSVEEVNAREDGGVVAPVGNQPGGVADEGETVGAIVDEMEREDSDNERVEEGDSSDDETDINPAEWASEDFSGLIVSEEDSVRWEYKENEVIRGAIYSRAEDMKEAVKHFAVSLHREFWVAKSNRSQYEVRCVKEKDGCPWRVHAYKGKWKDYWTVSVVTKHTCFLPGVQKYHRNITCAFVASEMYAHVIDNLTYEPRSIIRHIEETYKYTISYAKAWRAKQKIIEMRFGTYEASYDNLPRLLGVIEERNHGSSYEVKKFPSIEHPSKSVLQRAFLALHACKMAFVNCRSVLCIDGTFLTGKYRGQILTAIGVDGNNQVLPLAFAFVESENTDSWYWFLKLVKTKVVGMRPNVCLIHDRYAGILRAIEELQFGSMERGYPGVWEDVQSRWCMRHMGANFFKQFKNKELMNMFKRLCNQNQEKKFNELWKRLDELTAKCSDQRAAAPSTAVADPPQALGPLPTDSPTLVRKTGLEIRKFSQWILHEPKEKWAKAYDTGGARYGIMTTNLAEVYNWVMRGVRGLPLVGIVEFILHGTCRYFRDRFQAVLPSMLNNSILFGAFMQKKLEELRKKAMKHRAVVQGTQQHRFEILCQNKAGRGIYRKRVKQECVLKADGTCHCSCAKPKLLHRPCTHVIAAAAECGIPDAVYVSQYFSKQAIYHTWSGEIYGFGIAGEFTETNDEVLNIPDPSKLRGKAGRRRTRRIRNDMDESEAGRVKRCSKCDEHGHTYKHCPTWAHLRGATRGRLPYDGYSVVPSSGTLHRSYRIVKLIAKFIVHHIDRLVLQRRWAHVQVRRSYPEFVMEFDRLLPTDIVWEPYSAAATQARAPLGLSTLCTRDQVYWMTTVPMVFDICVEPHAPFRVMRQFGFRQPFPVPFPTTIPAAVHRYSRKGQHSAGDWPAKLATFVEDWLLATEEVDDINRVVVDGSTTIQRLGAGIPVPVEEHLTTYTRMVESMRSILRVLTCRADDVARADAAVQRPTIPTGPRPAAHVPRPTPPPHGGFRTPFSTPPSSARPSVVPPTGFAQFAMTQAAHFSQAAGSASQVAVSTSHSAQFWQYTGTSSQAAGTSSQGPPLDYARTSSNRLLPSTLLFDITDFDFASGSTEDVIGPSQLGGAPPVQTQDQAQATPPRDTRATRAMPPDRFTYSQDHVRAQARRTKRGRGAGQGQ
uniref:OSJNBb0061C13.9 protein n=2 Tax=Oryza sativa TaxID=4530 RepID=Q7XKL0_ORYSJ|nr:OSJNBb0061C13.9 [Oryza sativa Japonica Group]CAH67327.1 OSIGBa0102I15.7 [Oryza sativa]